MAKNLTKSTKMRQTMRMICDRVICKGGDSLSRKNYGKKEARLILFPDGINRLIVMGPNDWATLDKDEKITLRSHYHRLKNILNHSQRCANHYGWPVEMAIQYLFRLGMLGLSRKEQYGGDLPANDDDWANTMVCKQIPPKITISLTSVFTKSAL